MVRVNWSLQTNMVGSKVEDVAEFENEEWARMTESEREDAIREIAFSRSGMEWNYTVED